MARLRRVRQTLADPADHHDWVIEAVVDLDATDEAGELVLAATALRSLTGAPSESDSPNGPDQTTCWGQFRRSVNGDVAECLACSGRDIPVTLTAGQTGGARTSSYPPGARCSPSVAAMRPLRRLPTSLPEAPSPTKQGRRRQGRSRRQARRQARRQGGEKAASQVERQGRQGRPPRRGPRRRRAVTDEVTSTPGLQAGRKTAAKARHAGVRAR